MGALTIWWEKKSSHGEIQEICHGGIGKESPWETLKGQIFWGMDEFIKQLSGLLDEKENIKEVPKLQRYAARPSLSDLFKGKKAKERKDEDKTIYAAYVRYGYTMKEIADHLGFHYATISRAIKRVEGDKVKCIIARPDPI